MYITDVRRPFVFSDHLNVKHVCHCSKRFDWQNLRTPLMRLCMSQRGVLQGPKRLWTEVFLYIISQHIQAVSTWEDHFGPNDMARQQKPPKGT